MIILERAAVLGIYLEPTPETSLRVGTLVRDKAGAVTFMVDDAYLSIGPDRPLLSLAWKGRSEEDSIQRMASRQDKLARGGFLPAFFQNLLPEGALRDLVDREFGTGNFDDFDVLARLGGDLPGAVVAKTEAVVAENDDHGDHHRHDHRGGKEAVPPGRIKFSLAGIQLKFSVLERGRGVTAPGHDQHGNVILKLPSDRHASLPEVEYAGMTLAAAAGIETAKCWLVDVADIDGIPPEYLAGGKHALAVRRFDRAANGRRIHMEDFAQIIGAVGDRKYTMANDETNLSMIRRFAEDWSGELREGVRRIVANIMLGNGDAHLKNWSFLLDGNRPALTPAYDLVPTFLFGDNSMALKFGGTNDAARMALRRFDRVAGLLKLAPDILVNEARQTTERILDEWPAVLRDMPLGDDVKERIVDRWRTLDLVGEVAPSYFNLAVADETCGAAEPEPSTTISIDEP